MFRLSDIWIITYRSLKRSAIRLPVRWLGIVVLGPSSATPREWKDTQSKSSIPMGLRVIFRESRSSA